MQALASLRTLVLVDKLKFLFLKEEEAEDCRNNKLKQKRSHSSTKAKHMEPGEECFCRLRMMDLEQKERGIRGLLKKKPTPT